MKKLTISKLFFILLVPATCFGGEPRESEVSYINRVARNPASEIRFLQRRTQNAQILNPGWGDGWAHVPKFDGKEFQPNVQTKNGNVPQTSPSRLKLGWSFRMEHFSKNQDPTLRVGFSGYPGQN